MDISFKTTEGKFNYRVCAIIIDNNKILAMKDNRSPYYYLPGGRVKMNETAEHAIIREINEELKIKPNIIRPLWLNQAFFKEDVSNEGFHELCLYFLIDVEKTDLKSRGEIFSIEENNNKHIFEWITFDGLKNKYFYPLFLKKEIYNLPSNFTIRSEWE